MKIYAIITSVRGMGCMWDVIRYFSEDKEKCENYMKENDWKHGEIKEFESETKLNVSHQEIW